MTDRSKERKELVVSETMNYIEDKAKALLVKLAEAIYDEDVHDGPMKTVPILGEIRKLVSKGVEVERLLMACGDLSEMPSE